MVEFCQLPIRVYTIAASFNDGLVRDVFEITKDGNFVQCFTTADTLDEWQKKIIEHYGEKNVMFIQKGVSSG